MTISKQDLLSGTFACYCLGLSRQIHSMLVLQVISIVHSKGLLCDFRTPNACPSSQKMFKMVFLYRGFCIGMSDERS
jgi:hypothetical protein